MLFTNRPFAHRIGVEHGHGDATAAFEVVNSVTDGLATTGRLVRDCQLAIARHNEICSSVLQTRHGRSFHFRVLPSLFVKQAASVCGVDFDAKGVAT